MLAIEGALRGIWVGFLVMGIWFIAGELTGWDWMPPLNLPVALVAALVAVTMKIAKHMK